ncbi:hypothetical protein EHO59_11265 [Leptospira semungkisensis]|uniref:Lipoprotein n=1 Tax=Leptospira semungkisensis TaxID=2484985 RepID=A0A4V3JBC0_9LEPT|nr:hypothetical protein EHO59_11265 [Leptospira semungkisensis]
MRILFLLLAILALNSCASRYSLNKLEAGPQSSQKITKKFKIAYIGFNTFKSTKHKNPEGKVEFEAVAEQDSRTLREPIGGSYPIPGENKPNGLRKDISQEKVMGFARSYLSVTGPTGIKELEKFLEIAKGPEGYSYSLRNLPYDYYIVGLHSPVFEKPRNAAYGFLSVFSSLLSVVTIGILPSYEAYEANTLVRIYDKNLNLLKEFEYDNDYSVWRALWIPPNPKECGIGSLTCLGMFSPVVRTNPSIVFEAGSAKMSADLNDYIANLK